MPFITVKAGGPEIADGVYPVILTAISDPRTVTATRGPKAGEDVDLIDWTFAIDAPGSSYDGLEIPVSTSTRSGPKSKMYAFLTALFNGVAQPVGAGFEKDQLIGRQALATIAKNDAGWPEITNLGAVPLQMQQQRFAQATGTPVAPQAPAPVAATPTAPTAAAPTADNLPF